MLHAFCGMLQVLGALPPDQMEMFYNNPRFKGLKVNDRTPFSLHRFCIEIVTINSQLFNRANLLAVSNLYCTANIGQEIRWSNQWNYAELHAGEIESMP